MPARLTTTGSLLLAEALKHKDLTYREAGKLLGTSGAFVSMLISRDRAPGRLLALALQARFGIPVDAPWPVRRQRRGTSRNLTQDS